MTISVQCPTCGRELKLADRSLLGRKGKCPKCGNLFLLQETTVSAEVVPAAQPPLPAPPSAKESPPPAMLPAEPVEGPGSSPTSEAASNFVDWEAIVKEKPKPSLDFSFLETAEAAKSEIGNTANSPSPGVASLPDFGQAFAPGETATHLKNRQKKRKQSHQVGWIVGGVLGIVAIVVVVVAWQISPKNAAPKSQVPVVNKPVADPAEPKGPSKPAVDEAETDSASVDPSQTPFAKIGSPTHGTPIEMFYIPFGTAVVINLHPAELWNDTPPHDEIRKCVPPLFEWGQSVIKQLFQCEPDEVDELLICLIPGTRGSAPDVAAVARMMQEHDEEPFFIRDGVSIDTVEEDVFTLGQRAYLLVDEKTFATCPIAQMDEMIKAMKVPHPSKQIDALIPMTDHERELTVIVAPRTLALHETWFPEKLRPLIKACVEWMADDVDVMSWSMHFRVDLFYSEILLRNRDGNSRKLEKSIPAKLNELSKLVQSAVGKMKPTDNGKRMLIERLPAMIEVFAMATIVVREPHHLQLVTPLPDRAAPNLILATALAWDESTRTDFSVASSSAEGKKLPATVKERLKMAIDVDFRGSPMNESFAYISNEIGTKFELDGDALKAGGFTKNLKQSFRMDNTPVSTVIQKIFEEAKSVDSNPEKSLVIVVDESQKQVLVTTRAAAEKKGLTPADWAEFR